jgi:SAM-dependent methyltransferase
VVWEVLSAVLAEADPSGAGLDVLDAGGGTGGFAVPLAEAGHRVVVVDPSPDSLAALQRRAAERGLGRARRRRAGRPRRPARLVPAGSADLLLCHSVLEVVDDPAEALRALAGVLRPAAGSACWSPTATRRARPRPGRPPRGGGPGAHRPGRPLGAGRRRRPPLHPDALRDLLSTRGLASSSCTASAWSPTSCPSAVLDVEPGRAPRLLALERALSDRRPSATSRPSCTCSLPVAEPAPVRPPHRRDRARP